MIPIEKLDAMFENIREKSKWDTEGDLLWGYFFTDSDPEKLRPVADILANTGYRFVNIFDTEDGSTWFLHVEKIETHSPASLFQRNSEFYRLADEFCIESYDGMDVGPVKTE
jgi:Regulator of ribonuclease activity B